MKQPIIQQISSNIYFGNIDNPLRGINLIDPPIIHEDKYNWIRDDSRTEKKVLDFLNDENEYTRYIMEDSYLEILESHLKKLKETQPDIVFYQAGVDTLKEDKLGHMSITKGGLKKRDNIVLKFCKELGIPVLVFMGGGYSDPITHTVEAFTNLFQRCSRHSV